MSYTTAAMLSWARGLFGTAAFASMTLLATPALAIETGTPPQLPPPPPPPPPVGQSPPPAPPPRGAAPTKPAQTTGAPTRVMPASSTTSTSSVSTSDEGPSGGALDTRWALAGMIGVSTDYLNFGIGLRGGKTFDNHLYIGASMLYHFVGSGGYYGGGSASVFYIGPEGGYDFDLKPVVLRAYMGLGPAFFNYSVGPYSGSDTRFVVWPGASVLWNIGDSPWFIGGDVRFVSVPGGPAVGFFFTGGIHF